MKNADQIIPEFQTINQGDKVTLGPEGFPFLSKQPIFLLKNISP